MRYWIHVRGNMCEREYSPGVGKVLVRTRHISNGCTLEVCYHCEKAGHVEGELECECPHDADKCDVCGVSGEDFAQKSP